MFGARNYSDNETANRAYRPPETQHNQKPYVVHMTQGLVKLPGMHVSPALLRGCLGINYAYSGCRRGEGGETNHASELGGQSPSWLLEINDGEPQTLNYMSKIFAVASSEAVRTCVPRPSLHPAGGLQ